jgi:hypothetical protein
MAISRWLLVSAALIPLMAGCGGGGGNNGGTIPTPPPDGGVNQAPAITSVSPQGTAGSPVRIQVSNVQHIVVAASDPDNDPLTYAWTTDHGQIAGSGAEVDFTAPSDPATATVTVEVSDDHQHKVAAQVVFSVYKQDIDPPPPTRNDPPTIDSVMANPDSVELSGTSTITVNASDPDGDTLSYSWTTNGGSIQSQTNNTAQWKAPSVAGGCSVTVSVSDGHNPAVSSSVAIGVGGSVQPPITNGLTAKYIQNGPDLAHPDPSKGSVVFTRIDPNISFDWERKVPDPRLISLPNGTAHDFSVVWTGYIKCEEPGTYAFRSKYDDGFQLWISDDNNQMQTVIDGWRTGPLLADGQITLQGHKWYKFQAQYFEDEDRAYVQFSWMPPKATTWNIVPTDVFRTQ